MGGGLYVVQGRPTVFLSHTKLRENELSIIQFVRIKAAFRSHELKTHKVIMVTFRDCNSGQVQWGRQILPRNMLNSPK